MENHASDKTESYFKAVNAQLFPQAPAHKPVEKRETCFSIPDIKVISADEIPNVEVLQKQVSEERNKKPLIRKSQNLSVGSEKTLSLENLPTRKLSKQNLLNVFLRSFATNSKGLAYLDDSYRFCQSLPDLLKPTYMTDNIGDVISKDDASEMFEECFSAKPLSYNSNFLSTDSVNGTANSEVFALSPRSNNSRSSVAAVCASNPSTFSSESDDSNDTSYSESLQSDDRYERIWSSTDIFQLKEQGRGLKRCFSLGATD